MARPTENSNEPDSRARKRAGCQAFRRQGDPGFRPGRYRARQLQGGGGRALPYSGLRRRVHRARRVGAEREFHRPQDFLRRRGRARVSALLADDRLHQGRASRQGAARQALLFARPARQVGPHRREAGLPRTGRGRRRGGQGSRVTMARTLYDKIWDDHLVDEQPDGTCLIYIDRHLVHEVTSPQAFEGLRLSGRKVRAPEKTLAVVDHNVPTTDRSKGIDDPESKTQVDTLAQNAADFGVEYYNELDIRQGIVHVIGPEQ